MKPSSKRILIFLLLVIVLAGVGYYALWNAQATKAKELIEQTITRWNGDQPWLTYESISAVGFPTKVAVEIRKPKVSVQMDTLLKPLGESMPISPDGSETAQVRQALLNLPAWHEELLLEGAVRITVNLLSDKYGIDFDGNYAGKSNLNGDVTDYAIRTQEGRRDCELKFERAAGRGGFTLWDWDYLSGDPQALLNAFREVECHSPGYEMTLQGATPVFSISEAPLHFSTDLEDDKRDIALRFQFDRMLGTQEFDAVIAKYYTTLTGRQTLPLQYQNAPLGEVAFAIDLEMENIPADETIGLTDDFELSLNKLHYSSNLMRVDSHFIFENDVEDQTSKMRIDALLQGHSTEAAYNLYVEDAKQQAGSFYDQIAAYGNPLGVSREAFLTSVSEIVPKSHLWGESALVLKANATAAGESQFSAVLDKLAVNTTPYGLEGVGKADYKPQSMMPSGNLGLQCRNCITWIEDAVAWYNRAIPVFNLTAAPEKLEPVSDALKEGLKQFMLALSGGTAELMKFAIVNDEQGNLSINQKNMMDVLQLFQEHIGIHLPPPADAAPGEGAPPPQAHDGEAHGHE